DGLIDLVDPVTLRSLVTDRAGSEAELYSMAAQLQPSSPAPPSILRIAPVFAITTLASSSLFMGASRTPRWMARRARAPLTDASMRAGSALTQPAQARTCPNHCPHTPSMDPVDPGGVSP